MTAPPALPAGAASGLGPLPGTDAREAVRCIAGELGDLPFQPDLPARGVGADPVGRAVGLLVDVPAEVVPSGWRIAGRPGRDTTRALDHRDRDLDAVEEHLQGAPLLKVQVLGPWSLAAGLELRTGHRVLTDAGAVADVTESYAEGLQQQLRRLAARVPGTGLVVQVDEPQLAAVEGGRLPTASGFGTVRAVGAERLRTGLAQLAEAVAAVPQVVSRGITGVAPGPWWPALHRLGFDRLAVPLEAVAGTAVLDVLGETVGLGAGLLVPVTLPDRPTAVEQTTRTLVALWRALGFDLATLATTVVPLATGIAAADAVAPTLRRVAEVGRALVDPPAAWLA